MGDDLQDLSDYFESCRNKRNVGAYDRSGATSRSEAAELLEEAKAFNGRVRVWLRDRFPELTD
jgi:hypothetical protein